MTTQTQHHAMRMRPTITVRSPAFEPGRAIPREYTAHGDDVSPELQLLGVPPGARTLAIVVDDPDAPGGTFTHWTVWNLAPDLKSLPRGAEVRGFGGAQGENDFGGTRYQGPKPPSGTHRYFFRVFALDDRLPLGEGAGSAEVWAQLARHAIAWGELVGTFARP